MFTSAASVEPLEVPDPFDPCDALVALVEPAPANASNPPGAPDALEVTAAPVVVPTPTLALTADEFAPPPALPVEVELTADAALSPLAGLFASAVSVVAPVFPAASFAA